MIGVTKTYLPSLRKYNRYLREIWNTAHITNHGPFVFELEEKLKHFLDVKNLFAVANGTLGLQIAIKALDLSGEVVTTPFTYVASTSSLVWEGCKPVFVDIDPKTLCIDVNKIERAITKKTSAILAVHVYGNVCNVEKIDRIARKHHLKVIYDSAHVFGVKYKNKSILNYGDINILSFHATKIFHTAEGGAVTTMNKSLAHKISYLRNFGHNGEEEFWGLGINGKMSELHAAIGLLVLPKFNKLVKVRKGLAAEYDRQLNGRLQRPQFNPKATSNYSYYPVIFDSEKQLLKVRRLLNAEEIFPRRYFYPALTRLPYLKSSSCPIAEDISKRILCLPLFYDLKIKDVTTICKLVEKGL